MNTYDDTFHAAKRVSEGRGRSEDREAISAYVRAVRDLEPDAWGQAITALDEAHASDRLLARAVMEHTDAVTAGEARGPDWPQEAA